MDQAAKLREYKRKRNLNANLKMVSIISGKGGVGKTTLTKKLYREMDNTLIIDCDFNSMNVWKNSYMIEKGYDIKRAKCSLRDVISAIGSKKYSCVLVDCGTGLNQVNSYYVDKSRATIIVTNLEEMSVLNTANMIKRIDGNKIVYVTDGSEKDVESLQDKINIFSQRSLDNEKIRVFGNMDKLISYIEDKI